MSGIEEIYAELERLRRRVEFFETLEPAPGTPTPVYQNVVVKAANYTLTNLDGVVVFTATATASLPAATGSGITYRIANEGAAATVTIDGNGAETIKGAATQTLYTGEDLIITDYATGAWA